MIKYEIVVVPPGGGEVEFNVPAKGGRVPSKGEYIQLREKDEVSLFLIRNVMSIIENDNSPKGKFEEINIVVEVEPIDYELQSETQARMIERYKARGLDVKEWIPSGY